MSPKRVMVAMSGGVDSAGAALLLRREGYDVSGVTLRLHPYKDRPGLCGSAEDIETAAVAAALGIPHAVLDRCELFRTAVMDKFVSEYVHGRTPNPCVDCNRELKFGALLDWALDNGADYI
ncbi:MAG: tRNA 2-thiouridine(34) synthase MnmA, partial [Oscillibacter sp.]